MLGILGAGGEFNPLDHSQASALFWTWIIFLLALIPMWKIVFGPIYRALKERDLAAAESAKQAQAAREAAEKAQAAIGAERERAKGEVATLLQQARERAENLKQEETSRGRTEAERLIAQARQAIEQEKAKALSEIRGEVVDLSARLAEKALGKAVSNDQQRRAIAQAIEEEWRR